MHVEEGKWDVSGYDFVEDQIYDIDIDAIDDLVQLCISYDDQEDMFTNLFMPFKLPPDIIISPQPSLDYVDYERNEPTLVSPIESNF